ncbi:MAG: ATP-binding protein [Lachnospiraceae bacterium]|nr:ATP-binding protein [Lachnospiraceae bacterium]
MNNCVGIVDSVSSYEVKGYLLDSAPRSVSLAGGLTFFPRINGFLLIPNETGSLVGMISWIGYNHLNSENEVALPKGSRMISLSILGHIENSIKGKKFERGSFSLPTVGDQIVLPSEEELATIIKNDSEGTISIGTAPLTGNQEIKISINELFGRHIAVLGNTGSGKSCTVASLVRWSIEESIRKRCSSPNSRFVILDPNGEYGSAFDDLNVDVLKYTVQPSDDSQQLRIPAWMWTSNEWASVFRASDKTQKPILRAALRTLRSAADVSETGNDAVISTQQRLLFLRDFLKVSIVSQNYVEKEKCSQFGRSFEAKIESLKYSASKLDDTVDWKTKLITICDEGKGIQKKYLKSFVKQGEIIEYYSLFNSQEIEEYYEKIVNAISEIHVDESISLVSEDDPIEFPVQELPGFIEDIAGKTSAVQYVDFMTIRIKSMLKNATLSPVISNAPPISLLSWIEDYLGTYKEDSIRGKICIIDLSLLPSEIIHLMVATIARLIFESLQRYRRYYGVELPTVLIMEEAHNFIHRYSEDDAGSDKLCTQIFEKIAREGRKYGLGLLISSQRPAELSQTVLSQCNSFIIHRIVNDRDQDMINKIS